jgi:hypothetical protein
MKAQAAKDREAALVKVDEALTLLREIPPGAMPSPGHAAQGTLVDHLWNRPRIRGTKRQIEEARERLARAEGEREVERARRQLGRF